MKECIECKTIKELDLFVNKRNICKDCLKIYKKNYRKKNSELLKEKNRNYYLENKEHFLKKSQKYYEENKEAKLEYQKEYYNKNKDSVTEYKKRHAKENKDKIREYKNNYNERRKNDPLFKLKYVISRSIRNSLKNRGFNKSNKSIDILGCKIEFFKIYLEEKFTDEMTWENYGLVWDIDHIIPLATAKDEFDVIKLNHYTNLQPLNSHINRFVKKDKLDYNL